LFFEELPKTRLLREVAAREASILSVARWIDRDIKKGAIPLWICDQSFTNFRDFWEKTFLQRTGLKAAVYTLEL
jgi:hypothetical protein